MRHFLARRFLILTLLAAFALRLTQLTFQPLWYDEGWSVWFATSDLTAMLEHTALDIHPPLYYALLHGWIALAGSGEFALRYFSVAIGILVVAALYGLTRALAGEGAARWSALLAAMAPLQVFYAQEVRMYGLVTLLAIGSTWLFWRAFHGGTAAQWVAYVLVTAAALHTQYYGAFVPLSHALFAGGVFLRSRGTQPARWLAACAAIGILTLPWALYAGGKLAAYVGDKIAIEQYAPFLPHDYFARHLVAFSVGHLAPDVTGLGWFAPAFVLLALWGARGGGRSVPFLLVCLLVPLTMAWLVQLRLPFAPPRVERLLLLAAPPFLVLVAMGLDRISPTGPRSQIAATKAGQKRQPVAAIFLALIIACGASLVALFATPRYPEQDYRPLVARINALALPGDAVVSVHPWQVGFLRAYLGVPVALDLVAEPAWGDAVRAQLDAPLAANRRLWVPAFQTLGRILEGEMEQHLKRTAFNVESVWYGQTRLLFFAPPAALTQETLDERLTVGADRRGTPRESGWGIVPLEVAVFNDGPPPLRPRLGVRLKDSDGRLWSAQDREFDGVLRATSTPSGETWRYVSRLGFLTPAGTPPGEYRIAIAFYDELTGNVLRPETDVFTFTVTRPTMLPSVAALPIGTPLAADWSGARLLGYSMRDGEWKPGESVHLDLFWRATADAIAERLLFAQVESTGGELYAISRDATAQPARTWRSGDLMREQRDLRLPASIPPGVYRIVVGWLDASTRAGVPLTGGGDQLVLRTIAVAARSHQMTPPTPQTRAEWHFGTLARIVGYDLTLDAPRGVLTMRLHWQGEGENGTPFKVFVHLVPLAGGAPIAQHDAEPVDGMLPTTAWIRGEYIADEHVITLPPGAPAGAYRVLVGMYEPHSGIRLPVLAADGSRVRDDAAPLATVELR